jgi:hypothetical protein
MVKVEHVDQGMVCRGERQGRMWGNDQKLSLTERDDAKKAESSRCGGLYRRPKWGLIGRVSITGSVPP